jgi:hypothetical protein
VGYETTGEAEFWENPVAMDLAGGAISRLDAWPAGMTAGNSTGPLDRIDPAGGAVLAETGLAKGTPAWVIRRMGGDDALDIDPGATLAWATGQSIVVVAPNAIGSSLPMQSPVPAGDWTGVWTRPVTPGAGPTAVVAVPNRTQSGAAAEIRLQSTNGAFALLLRRPPTAGSPTADPGWAEALLVDLSDGAIVVAVPPAISEIHPGMTFAGWVAPAR